MVVDLEKGKAALREFGASGKSSMAPTTVALRELEGNLANNTRGVARFLADTLKLGPVLSAAFPLIGGIAFAGMIGSLATKVGDFFHNMEEAPRRIADAFRGLNEPLRLTNDELQVTNDRLANDIAKLEGGKQNTMKLALDEARMAADKLAESLDKDLAALNKLLKEQHATAWDKLFGTAGNEDLQKEYSRFRESVAGVFATPGPGLDRPAGVLKLYNDELMKTARLLDDALAKQQKFEAQKNRESLGLLPEPQDNPELGTVSDQSRNIKFLQGALQQLQYEKDRIAAQTTNAALTAQKEALKAQPADASDAEYKKRREFVRELDRYERELQDKRIKEAGEAAEGYAKGIEEGLKDQFKEEKFSLQHIPSLASVMPSAPGETVSQLMARLGHEGRMGAIGAGTPAQAALQEYQSRLDIVNRVYQRESAIADLAKQRELDEKHVLDLSEARYQYEERMADLRKRSRDEIANPVIGGVSGQFADLVTGQKTNVGKMLQQVAHQEVQTQTEKMMHSAFDKLMPPKQQHVYVDNLPGGLSGVSGSASAGAPWSESIPGLGPAISAVGGIGGVFKSIGGLIGGLFGGGAGSAASSASDIVHLAEGGDVDPGQSYWVGDGGEAELFSPRTAGTITPAHKLAGSGGPVYQIDARGAELGAYNRIARGIEAAHNSAVETAIRANHERSLRTPKRSS